MTVVHSLHCLVVKLWKRNSNLKTQLSFVVKYLNCKTKTCRKRIEFVPNGCKRALLWRLHWCADLSRQRQQRSSLGLAWSSTKLPFTFNPTVERNKDYCNQMRTDNRSSLISVNFALAIWLWRKLGDGNKRTKEERKWDFSNDKLASFERWQTLVWLLNNDQNCHYYLAVVIVWR